MYYNAVDERGEIIINGMSDRGDVYEFHELSPFGNFAMLYDVTQELSESTSLADAIAKEPTKYLANSTNLTEIAISKEPTHYVPETVNLADSFSCNLIKYVSENISLIDSLAKEPEKRMADTVHLSDSESKTMIHSIIESLTATDSVIKHPEKRVTDTISMTDSIVQREVNKYIHETLTLVDSVRRAGDCLVSDIYSYAARLTKNSKTGRQR